jgi:glycine cleavage system aminomethyltransferase T
LWGPKAREVLQSITADDVSDEGFPFGTVKELIIDNLRVLAFRISYVG